MERGNRGKRILSAVMLLVLVTALSCYAAGRSGKEAPDEKMAVSGMEVAGAETDLALVESGEDSPKMEEQDIREMEEEEFQEKEATEEEEPVFGRGMESEESLAEWVVTAMKSGDTDSLIGVELGEQFDYNEFRECGKNSGRPKEPMYGYTPEYLFEGKGHRFSGFSITRIEEPFLGISLGKTSASLFVKAFGEPDRCEVSENAWGEYVLTADWYFDKAVLTVEDREGYVSAIEYKALGDAADGGEDSEKLSDFALRMKKKSEKEKAETVYGWWDSDEDEKDVFYPSEGDNDGVDNMEEFVKQYLESEGFGGQDPESVIYDAGGKVFAEGYLDEDREKFCFLIYDYDKVCCATRTLSEADKSEYLVYLCDEAGNTVQETQYDIWGVKMAEISCTYHDGFPFPFLTESWNTKYEGYDSLCREYKTWFYEEDAEFDRQGRVLSVTNEHADAKSYFWYPCYFTCRRDGKLKKVQEEIPEDQFYEEDREYREGYYGDMELTYSEDGKLKKMEYEHSSYFHGTGDQSGTIDFDEQGRMVHNYYYVTSGCHDEFYFYHGDERKPWAVLDWCHDIWSVDVYRPTESGVYP